MPAAVVAADALVHVARDVFSVVILLVHVADFDHEIGILEIAEIDWIASPLVKAVAHHRLGRVYAPVSNARLRMFANGCEYLGFIWPFVKGKEVGAVGEKVTLLVLVVE